MSRLGILLSLAMLAGLASPTLAQSGPSASVTMTADAGGTAYLSVLISGASCSTWVTRFRLCGEEPYTLVPPGVISWWGNSGRASAPYIPSLSGACLEFEFFCQATNTTITATARYP